MVSNDGALSTAPMNATSLVYSKALEATLYGAQPGFIISLSPSRNISTNISPTQIIIHSISSSLSQTKKHLAGDAICLPTETAVFLGSLGSTY